MRRSQQCRRSDPTPGTEYAWRALGLTVEWTKHAETKGAVVLATAGVLGGLLYGMINQVNRPAPAFVVAASSCVAAIGVTGGSAATALWPRIRPGGRDPGLLFFRGVADRYAGNMDAYVEAFAAFVRDDVAVRCALARQIWAASDVAKRKYRALNVAVGGLLVSITLIAVTAALRLAGD
ncbi:Pycsar system effector family protein [Actinoplanes sp. NPDC089786]|uniref:Pycsar system effector family protein n=1 Tax=Actinoplanes sp. NPDC089786 TaxID=3155185 RepID=UPI003449C38C